MPLRRELLGDELGAVALLRLALAAHEGEPVASLEVRESFQECRLDATAPVVDSVVFVEAGGIVRSTAE